MEAEEQKIEIPKQTNKQGLEEFLEKNKLTVGVFNTKYQILFILGVILLGLGVLGFKIFSFTSNQPKVEILGESDSPLTSSNHPLTSSIVAEAAGEVQKPGVYELQADSRVNDLLVIAGGLSAEADRDWVEKNINMAARLQDGAKIYIPNKLKVQSEKLKVDGENKVNINTASESELDTLWGIGLATAKKIIEGRPYQRSEELLEKKIVKSNVWEKIKEKVTVY